MQFKAEVKVTLKRGVLDPQGAAVQGALHTLGYSDFTGVRVGKLVELWLSAENEAAAREQVEAVSRKLLANPILEHFTYTLTPAEAGPEARPATTGAALATGDTANHPGAPFAANPGPGANASDEGEMQR